MGKIPQFSCKMKPYIQNNVISSQNGILFSNDTHKLSYEDIYKNQLTDVLNGKHFFYIHHNDLGLFVVQCYTYSYYQQYT